MSKPHITRYEFFGRWYWQCGYRGMRMKTFIGATPVEAYRIWSLMIGHNGESRSGFLNNSIPH